MPRLRRPAKCRPAKRVSRSRCRFRRRPDQARRWARHSIAAHSLGWTELLAAPTVLRHWRQRRVSPVAFLVVAPFTDNFCRAAAPLADFLPNAIGTGPKLGFVGFHIGGNRLPGGFVDRRALGRGLLLEPACSFVVDVAD